MDNRTIALMMEVIFKKWCSQGHITQTELMKVQEILWRMNETT